MNKRLFALIFFLSGFSGLIYQILWMRLFALSLGNTFIAISMIVAAFLGGLFAGAWLVGKYMGRCRNELRWYALLEILVGCFALLLLLVFPALDRLYLLLGNWVGNWPIGDVIAKFILTFGILFLPTAAMGATLPLVVQYYTRSRQMFGDNIGLFYAINTVGGAAGVLMAGFVLLEQFGVTVSILATGCLNLVLGLTVWLAAGNDQKVRPAEPAEVPETPLPVRGKKKKKRKTAKVAAGTGIPLLPRGVYLAAAGLTGFAALACEIIWTRALKFLILNSTYSFSAILFTFLLGIGIGSFIFRRFVQARPQRLFLFGVLQAALGIYVAFSAFLLYQVSYTDFFQKNIVEVIYDYSYSWEWGIAVFIFICVLTLLLPTVIMGITFPLINQIYFEDARRDQPGRAVSAIYATNTVGSILGSIGASAVLLTTLGIKQSLYLMAGVNLALGIFFLWQSREKAVPALVGSLVLFGVVLFVAKDGRYLYGRGESPRDRILFYEEGVLATVKVFDKNRFRFMSIDGVSIASTHRNLLQKEKLIAHLPFFINPGIREVLAVGLASGISIGSMTLHPAVRQIDCVELVKPVFAAARFFDRDNREIFQNPRVNFIYNDIYGFMKYTPKQYDLISSDGKLGTAYSGNNLMLSHEYFELCKTRLKPGGLFIHWLPLITPYRVMKIVAATLQQTFPHVALFYFYPSDVFMVASDEPITLDSQKMAEVLANSDVLQDVSPFFVTNPTAVLTSFAGFYLPDAQPEVPLNSLDRPILEFAYLREWKKSRQYEGGYRAKNMEFLYENLVRNDPGTLTERVKLPGEISYQSHIFEPTQQFFVFSIENFRHGNYQNGLNAYVMLKNRP